jgi:CHAP domain
MSEADVIQRVLRIAGEEAQKSADGELDQLKPPGTNTNNVKYNTAYYKFAENNPDKAWCVVFIWWVMRKAGVPETVFPKVASVFKQKNANVRDFFKDRHRFMSASSMPKEGDLVIFKKSHIGIVENVEGNTISTIEGNASDRVRRHSYSRTNPGIDGYCHPAYELVEEDDFMALFDNVNEFKAAVRAVVKDEVDKAVQGELKDFFVLLARGGDPVPGPEDQHFKDSHRGVNKQITDIYKLLARGEIDGEINPTSTHFKDSNRHLAQLLGAIATATNAELPQPSPSPGP